MLEFDFLNLADHDVMDWDRKTPYIENIAKISGQIENYINDYDRKKWANYPDGAQMKEDLGQMDTILSTYVTRLMLANEDSGGMILTEYEKDAFDHYQKYGSTKQIKAVYQTAVRQFDNATSNIEESIQRDLQEFTQLTTLFNYPQNEQDKKNIEEYLRLYALGSNRSENDTVKMNDLTIEQVNPMYSDETETLSETIPVPISSVHADILNANKRLRSNEITFQNINQGQRYYNMNYLGDRQKSGIEAIDRQWEEYDLNNTLKKIMPSGEFFTLDEIFKGDIEQIKSSKEVKPSKISLDEAMKGEGDDASTEKQLVLENEEEDSYIDVNYLSEESEAQYNKTNKDIKSLENKKKELERQVKDIDPNVTKEDISEHYQSAAIGEGEPEINQYEDTVNKLNQLKDNNIKTYTDETSPDISYASKVDLRKTLSLWTEEYNNQKSANNTDAKSVEEYYQMSDGTNPFKNIQNRIEKFDDYIEGEMTEGFSLKDNPSNMFSNYIRSVPVGISNYNFTDDQKSSEQAFFDENPNLDIPEVRREFKQSLLKKIDGKRRNIQKEREKENPDQNKINKIEDELRSAIEKSTKEMEAIINKIELEDVSDVNIKRTYGKDMPKDLSINEFVNGELIQVSDVDKIIDSFVYSLDRNTAAGADNMAHNPYHLHSKKFFENNPNFSKSIFKTPLADLAKAKVEYDNNPGDDKLREKYNQEYQEFKALYDFMSTPMADGGAPLRSHTSEFMDSDGNLSNNYLNLIDWSNERESFKNAIFNIPYNNREDLINKLGGTGDTFRMSSKGRKKFEKDFGLLEDHIKSYGQKPGGKRPIDGLISDIWGLKEEQNRKMYIYNTQGKEAAKKEAERLEYKINKKINTLFGYDVFKGKMKELKSDYEDKIDVRSLKVEMNALLEDAEKNMAKGETPVTYFERLKKSGSSEQMISAQRYFDLDELIRMKDK